ncbi:cupin domain-containing protein [Promicromonospora panici]|uniref:cupin domain-containing protein n=1 Tax=Promicromonospora panici TaxID=2219658 RepID=UPI00101C7D85|nr:cupin domain-containing protein [Promicromonospora panici]
MTKAANNAISITDCLHRITEHWAPKRIATVNDYDVRVVKILGEFVWHAHPETDELFLVVDGRLTIQLRDGDVTLGPGELYVVPRGVEHCPIADEETSMVLFEPTETQNTGDAGGPRTREAEPLGPGRR